MGSVKLIMNLVRPTWSVLCIILMSSLPVMADDEEITCDIFRQDSHLTAAVNLTPCLSTKAIRQLKDGIDLVLDCQVTLVVPRKIVGDRFVSQVDRRLRLGYQPVTGDYMVTTTEDRDTVHYQFSSLVKLREHLRDSTVVRVIPVDSLDPDDRYVLTSQVDRLSLTDLNLLSDDHDSSSSPIRFLFKQFLNLTGYGHKEYQSRSCSFALSEIRSER